MVKKITFGFFLIILAGAWYLFHQSGLELKRLTEHIDGLYEMGDPESKAAVLAKDLTGLEGQHIFTGILLTFVSTGIVGIFLAVKYLPILARKMSNGIYDHDEEVEDDVLREGRVFLAQGKWEQAIEAFRKVSIKEPQHRTPYLEIAKIQRNHLADPQAAIHTLRTAIEGEVWPPNDAAFFLFRLIEIYEEDLENKGAAVILLEQVMEQFPGTRHSANARAKLHEWGMA